MVDDHKRAKAAGRYNPFRPQTHAERMAALQARLTQLTAQQPSEVSPMILKAATQMVDRKWAPTLVLPSLDMRLVEPVFAPQSSHQPQVGDHSRLMSCLMSF